MAADGGAAPEGVAATPEMIAAAWRAFRAGRPGALLGPGPGFVEAINAALALAPRRAADAGAGDEVGRLTRERDEANASLHRCWAPRFSRLLAIARRLRDRTITLAEDLADAQRANRIVMSDLRLANLCTAHYPDTPDGSTLAMAHADLDRARDELAEWMKHVAEVNAHAGRMQDKAAAAEARAEAAEGERDAARAESATAHHVGYLAAINDMRRAATALADDSIERSLAAQLGGAAREGGADCRKSRQTDATDPTPSRDGGDRGPG